MEFSPWGIVLIWYIIGLISLIYYRHIREYREKGRTTICLADIILHLITAVLGPIVPLTIFVVWFVEKGIFTKDILTIHKPHHKMDKTGR